MSVCSTLPLSLCCCCYLDHTLMGRVCVLGPPAEWSNTQRMTESAVRLSGTEHLYIAGTLLLLQLWS